MLHEDHPFVRQLTRHPGFVRLVADRRTAQVVFEVLHKHDFLSPEGDVLGMGMDEWGGCIDDARSGGDTYIGYIKGVGTDLPEPGPIIDKLDNLVVSMGWVRLDGNARRRMNHEILLAVERLEASPRGTHDEDAERADRAEEHLGQGSIGHRLLALHATGRIGPEAFNRLNDRYDASIDPFNIEDGFVRIAPPDWWTAPSIPKP